MSLQPAFNNGTLQIRNRRMPWQRTVSNIISSTKSMVNELFQWSSCSGWICLASHERAEGGQINFFTHTGEKSEQSVLTRSVRVTVIAWHPSEAVVALGWEDGYVTLISPSRELDISKNFYHITPEQSSLLGLNCIEWSHEGNTLCLIDSEGHILLYSYVSQRAVTNKLYEINLIEKPKVISKKLQYERRPNVIITNDNENVDKDEPEMQQFNAAMRERNRKIGFRLGSAHLVPRQAIGSTFIVGGENGTISAIEETGNTTSLYKLDKEITYLAFYEEKSLMIVMTVEFMIYHLIIENDETWQEKIKVKLSGHSNHYDLLLNDNLLIISYQERDIRIWDLDTDENGIISLQTSKGFDAEDVIMCVAYSKRKGIISAGTADGKIANWKRRHGEATLEDTWRLQSGNQVGAKILSLAWSPIFSAMAVNTGSEMTILQEDNTIICFKNKVAAIQTGPTSFSLLNVMTSVSQELKLPLQAKGIHLGDKQLVVWTSDTILTYDVQSSLATIQSTSFSCVASEVIIHQQTLFCIEGDKINARTIQGTVRQILSLPEMEGDPVLMNANKSWLTVATSNGFFRIYNLGKKEVRQEFHSKYVIETIDKFHRFSSIKGNISGNKVACIYYVSPTELSDCLLVWDAEADNIGYFSFEKGMTDQQEYEAEAELANTSSGRPVTAAARKIEREQNRFRMMLHKPMSIHWDDNDPRFLVCEAVGKTPEAGEMILSIFITSEHGIQLQDLQKKSAMCDVLIGVSVPHMYFIKKMEYDDDEIRGERIIGRIIVARSLREFAGVENCDEQTRKGMMDFCFYLTIGHMDEAFKAIKFIKSESVWEHMASMSVKTRRLDVAAVCLGNMKNLRGARALRKAQDAGESEAMQCAVVAVELGMLDEAEALYTVHGRYDMVNKIHQAQNSWNQAFDIASRYDRIHLRNTHYNYAKYLEMAGALEPAIENFEKSETHIFEVPRMFMDQPKILEAYVRRKREPELQKWWARYLESMGELDGAVNFYMSAKDIMSVVRIRCTQGRINEAAALGLETGDKAACYHLARIYEVEGDHIQAVNFYTKAHAFSSAIRIAKEHDMRDKLANLCLMAGEGEMVEAARYYEDIPGYVHKAVMLYHKAGMIGRALNLAFRTEQFSALDLVMKDLDSSCEPTVLKRAAEFFTNNQNYEKAVELLCMAKEFRAAINLCQQKNVRMSEKVAELMTPNKETTPDANERKQLLDSVAELCLQQGNYNFAAKKYTQAGDKLQAMRALLKSGDTQKIRFFANTARSKELYILAANYLQTTDWQGNSELIRDIETYYTKAQSHEHLASFYQACAFMEIENYNDFEKAADALEHAQRSVSRGLEGGTNVIILQEIQEKIRRFQNQIKKFDKIKSNYASDPADAVRQLQNFAEEATEADIIRPGHIFALLIAHHAGKQNWSPAYRCILQLQKQQPKLDLTTVVDAEILNRICDEMRVERVTKAKSEKSESDEENNEVEYSHAMKKQLEQ